MAHSNFPQPFLWKNKDFTAKSKLCVYERNFNKLTLSSAGAIVAPLPGMEGFPYSQEITFFPNPGFPRQKWP